MKNIFNTYCFIILFGLLSWESIHAQTFELPDTNLRNVLLSKYPQVISNGLLKISEAKKITGELNIKNSNIRKINGLEYFTSINSLNISGNAIDTIKGLGTITGLQYLFAYDNKAKHVEGFENSTELIDFQIQNNQITNFPNIEKASNLTFIYCYDNLLKNYPNFKNLKKLYSFVAGNNPLEKDYDYGELTGLRELHVHSTGIDTIIGLEKLTNLKVLYAWGNRIQNLDALNQLLRLEIISAFNNELKTLPELTNKPNLYHLSINNNYLSFEDLKNINTSKFMYYSSNPQKKFYIPNYQTRSNSKLEISIDFDQTVTDNIYVWKKGAITIDSSSNRSLVIQTIDSSHSGTYSLSIYNSTFPLLVLQSNSFTIDIKKCLEITSKDYEIYNTTCNKGYDINFKNVSLEGGSKPFQYKLTGINFTKINNEGIFKNIPPGKTTLIITDDQKCSAQFDFILNSFKNCEEVFSPNDDGVADTYFINETGEIKIYDTQRKLINSFNGPITWDGKDTNGKIAETGLYAIIINDSKVIYISIIR